MCSTPEWACRRANLFLRFALSDAVPALARDVGCLAQGDPDRACGYAGADRLLCRKATHIAENEVAREHPAVGFAEFDLNGPPEFA